MRPGPSKRDKSFHTCGKHIAHRRFLIAPYCPRLKRTSFCSENPRAQTGRKMLFRRLLPGVQATGLLLFHRPACRPLSAEPGISACPASNERAFPAPVDPQRRFCRIWVIINRIGIFPRRPLSPKGLGPAAGHLAGPALTIIFRHVRFPQSVLFYAHPSISFHKGYGHHFQEADA